MPVALFWNLNRKALGREVAQLCKIHNVDILVIAEAGLPDVALQHLLSQETKTTYIAPFNEFSSRVKFFFRYPPESIRLVADSYGLSIREVRPPIGESLLLVGVHLSSKLYADRNEQSAQARLAICTIAEAEQSVGHKRTLVIGDFNMNPFEGGLVDADTFHGVMDQSIAKENMRTVRQVERRFFYNPMWGKLGDSSEGPPGTYYYKSSKNREFFWNTFDQVLIRPELIPFYQEGLLKVLTEIYDTQLMTDGKISNDFSDHLPIMIKLATE
ncbi:MAG: endonuclease/exonuclease/phosphatase family protein [Cyanobacteria bacterium J06607_10]